VITVEHVEDAVDFIGSSQHNIILSYKYHISYKK